MTPGLIYIFYVVDDRLEQHEAVGAAERQLARALRMWHQADHVALFAAEAGDVGGRAIRIRGIGRNALLVGIAEDDLPVRLEPRDDVRLRVVVPLAMRDRDAQHLAGTTTHRERRVGLLDLDEHVLAMELDGAIAKHRARNHPPLEQNLKAVPAAEHRP